MYENDNKTDTNGLYYGGDAVLRSTRTKKRSGLKLVLSLILCGLLFGAAAAAAFTGVNALLSMRGSASAQKSEHPSPTESVISTPAADQGVISTAPQTQSTTQSSVLDVSAIAEDALPSMVSITNISVQEVMDYFGLFGRGQKRTEKQQSSGTGIIIGTNKSELLIVTNNHVVEDSTTLSVCFVDDEVCESTVKGTDPDNDLAVIAVKLSNIKESTTAAIKQARIGSSDTLKVGQQVVAIGNALGYGQSVTTGIVSALNRRIDTADAIMIQTDAAINPGNSGGALLNMAGEVVGINSAKFSSTDIEGMGYAISITPATPIIEDLMNRTTRERVSDAEASYLGVSGEDITADISSAYGIPQGIYVTRTGSGSPAQLAGIGAKSIITHFDGIRVTSLANLENRLKYYKAGETVEITLQVIKNNEYVEKTVSVTLGRAADYSSGYGYQRP